MLIFLAFLIAEIVFHAPLNLGDRPASRGLSPVVFKDLNNLWKNHKKSRFFDDFSNLVNKYSEQKLAIRKWLGCTPSRFRCYYHILKPFEKILFQKIFQPFLVMTIFSKNDKNFHFFKNFSKTHICPKIQNFAFFRKITKIFNFS